MSLKARSRKAETSEKRVLRSSNAKELKSNNTNATKVRDKLLKTERKRIFSESKPLIKRLENKPKPVAYLEEHKLRQMLCTLQEKSEINHNQKELKKCLAHMNPQIKPIWTSPCYVMKAVNDCLLTRNWNNLTYMLLELVHLNSEIYKPIVRNVFPIMDKLHPVICENGLQGEFKNIKKYHQKILDDTTVV